MNNNIKQNIIDRFLIPYYKYSTVYLINTVIANITEHSWFPCTYNMETNILTMDMGDNVKVDIKFIWKHSLDDKERNTYILKDFE